ncbi:phosphomannose isomerase type II C-terminal cupin domain [Yunchengibacter salinarum]|uniref:phosphomannose isomerase type II C-terminal cupin domain n=1 Tax=Yunchengibacter salinarum TaxID=3133399 RepID=UPI0035B5A221
MTTVQYAVGDADERPWGRWEVVAVGPGHVVKRITVKPGQILSLQLHHHRGEHWVITQGTARVTLGGDLLVRGVDEAVYIPVETPHRIENVGDGDLQFIEVQTGAHLDENDIVRLEDKYGRQG